MKLKICFAVALAIGMAQAEDGQAKKKAETKKKSTPPAELTLPAGAVMVEPGTYTFTDAQGKKWIYRKTPFGLARLEDKPADSAAPAAPAASAGMATTATEDGDTVRFERPGPFGTYRWQKKKTELDADEQAALDRLHEKSAAKARHE
jgi:hypothetical protein